MKIMTLQADNKLEAQLKALQERQFAVGEESKKDIRGQSFQYKKELLNKYIQGNLAVVLERDAGFRDHLRKKGLNDEQILSLQKEMMQASGIYARTDGQLAASTRDVVAIYQEYKKTLVVDGIYGHRTDRQLVADVARLRAQPVEGVEMKEG